MAGLAAVLRRHHLVGLDTSIFIYHIEGSSRYADVAATAFNELAAGTFTGVTSVLTLMELTVKPLQLGRPEVADHYELVVASYPHLTIVGVDQSTARRAAELRASYRLRPADALQIAACLKHGATAFLTNDRDLRRLPGPEILLLDDFVAP